MRMNLAETLKAERNGKKKAKQVTNMGSGLKKSLTSLVGKKGIPKPPMTARNVD